MPRSSGGRAVLRAQGATVDEVSIPMHLMGVPIWLPIAAEGATVQMMQGNGYGFNWKGLYVTSLLDFHSGWRNRADELSDTLKTHDAAGLAHGHATTAATTTPRRRTSPASCAPPTTRCSRTTTCWRCRRCR